MNHYPVSKNEEGNSSYESGLKKSEMILEIWDIFLEINKVLEFWKVKSKMHTFRNIQ